MPDLNSIDKGTAREAAKPPEDESIWKTIGGGLTNPENYFLLMEILGSADPSGRPLQMIGELGEAHYARKRKKQMIEGMREKYPEYFKDMPEALQMEEDIPSLMKELASARGQGEFEDYWKANRPATAPEKLPPGAKASDVLKFFAPQKKQITKAMATYARAHPEDPDSAGIIAAWEEEERAEQAPKEASFTKHSQEIEGRERRTAEYRKKLDLQYGPDIAGARTTAIETAKEPFKEAAEVRSVDIAGRKAGATEAAKEPFKISAEERKKAEWSRQRGLLQDYETQARLLGKDPETFLKAGGLIPGIDEAQRADLIKAYGEKRDREAQAKRDFATFQSGERNSVWQKQRDRLETYENWARQQPRIGTMNPEVAARMGKAPAGMTAKDVSRAYDEQKLHDQDLKKAYESWLIAQPRFGALSPEVAAEYGIAPEGMDPKRVKSAYGWLGAEKAAQRTAEQVDKEKRQASEWDRRQDIISTNQKSMEADRKAGRIDEWKRKREWLREEKLQQPIGVLKQNFLDRETGAPLPGSTALKDALDQGVQVAPADKRILNSAIALNEWFKSLGITPNGSSPAAHRLFDNIFSKDPGVSGVVGGKLGRLKQALAGDKQFWEDKRNLEQAIGTMTTLYAMQNAGTLRVNQAELRLIMAAHPEQGWFVEDTSTTALEKLQRLAGMNDTVVRRMLGGEPPPESTKAFPELSGQSEDPMMQFLRPSH